MMETPEPPLHRRAARATLPDDRSPPRFVGSGRGVMVAVLSLVAVLLVARGVATWWMAREAWRWWTAPPTFDSPVQPPVAPPPADARLAGRHARGDPAAAFGPDAYPAAALRAGAQGRTVALLRIDRAGRPLRCTVRTGSGSSDLDAATCRVAMTRLRLLPARDGSGRPVASDYVLPVRWVLPR